MIVADPMWTAKDQEVHIAQPGGNFGYPLTTRGLDGSTCYGAESSTEPVPHCLSGPDGEDGLMNFLQGKLRGWQLALQGYKQLAETGQYPGGEEITQGLTLIGPLLADLRQPDFGFVVGDQPLGDVAIQVGRSRRIARFGP
jgi:hypothetical protein